MLELALQQSGTAASRAAAEDASGSGKEGSSAGILKVWAWHGAFWTANFSEWQLSFSQYISVQRPF